MKHPSSLSFRSWWLIILLSWLCGGFVKISATTNLYFADHATGDGSGSSVFNCRSNEQVNTSGLVGGDTAYIVRIWTNQLNVQISGYTTNYINFVGISNMFVNPCWGINNAGATPGAAINVYFGDSYLTFSNLNVINTSNGMFQVFSNDTTAMNFQQSVSIKVIDCTASNMYYRIAGLECGNSGRGIQLNAIGNNYEVTRCKIDMVGNAINVSMNPIVSGGITNVWVTSNTLTHCSFGTFFNVGGNGNESGIKWNNNYGRCYDTWYPSNGPCSGPYHQNAFVYNCGASFQSNTNHDMEILNNHVWLPEFTGTAAIKVTPDVYWSVPRCLIANNIGENAEFDDPANGFICTSANDVYVINNTLIHYGSASYSAMNFDGARCLNYNNLIIGFGQMFATVTNSYVTSDYNSYNVVGSGFANILRGPSTNVPGLPTSFANYTNLVGSDRYSFTNLTVTLTGFVPSTNSPIADAATNLVARFPQLATDYNGVTRGTLWTIGAFEANNDDPFFPSTNTLYVPMKIR